ncbi:hypothetical protein GlitD10_0627 [Gloeomargarita lithophora Alchichica-D10]|uniref:Uncharacterized protein n=1 Tax=Gloeomargarita lithophora Alchichica-D10 TaxID=1188229 RepID=A0A1J0AAK7_9CYAN|nr:hypothetical protein GlitD10_0627 [Gloeomargarita lithophora Alchichica-D10]
MLAKVGCCFVSILLVNYLNYSMHTCTHYQEQALSPLFVQQLFTQPTLDRFASNLTLFPVGQFQA